MEQVQNPCRSHAAVHSSDVPLSRACTGAFRIGTSIVAGAFRPLAQDSSDCRWSGAGLTGTGLPSPHLPLHKAVTHAVWEGKSLAATQPLPEARYISADCKESWFLLSFFVLSFKEANNIPLDSSPNKHITLKDNCFAFTAPDETIDKKHQSEEGEKGAGGRELITRAHSVLLKECFLDRR